MGRRLAARRHEDDALLDWGRRGARLMRSSRSISYWDLGATGMFDGILIDEKCLRAVAWARAVPASRRFLGWRQQPDSALCVHGAQMPGFRRSGQVYGCEVLSPRELDAAVLYT